MSEHNYIANFEYPENEPIEANFEIPENDTLEANLIVNAVVADKHYTHHQSIASGVWTVNHNLNKKCSITVVDSAGNVQIPDDEDIVDKNTVVLKFLAPFAGEAYFN